MAVQNQIIRPSGGVTSQGTWNPISSYSPLTSGGTNQGNISDQNNNSGSSSVKPAWIRHQMDDVAGFTDDLIDAVRLEAVWATNASTKLHFSIWLGVSGVEYPNNVRYGSPPYNGGHSGDTWTGDHSALALRQGRNHATQPDGSAWSQTGINGMTLRAEVWNDSDVDVQLREMYARILYYRQPTLANLAVGGAVTSVARTASWDFVGDAGQNAAEYYVYPAAATPGDPGFVKKGNLGSGREIEITHTTDGTYYLYVRANLKGALSGGIIWSDWYSVSYIVNRPPNAPRLLNPTNGTKRDVGVSGWKSQWQFQHPSPGKTQQAYLFRRRIAGGNYQYWKNSDRTWQTTPQLNTSVNTEITWQAGEWSNGNRYEWSVSTTDNDGEQSAYAPNFTVEGDTGPSIVVDNPSGTINFSATPLISGTYTDQDGDPQDQVHFKVYEESVYTLSGFNPDNPNFIPVWNSGEIATAGTQATPPVLQNGLSYRAYMRVHSDGVWSAWAYSEFEIDLVGPAPPTLIVTGDPLTARNRIRVQTHDNLLSFADSTLEDTEEGTDRWVPLNTTITQSATMPKSGTYSLRVQSTGGDAYVWTGDAGAIKAYAPVIPNEIYTGVAFVRPNAVGDVLNVKAMLRYYDSAWGWLGASEDAHGQSVALVAGTWTKVAIEDTAPLNAAYASLMINFLGNPVAGKVWFVDEAGIMIGQTARWGVGGFADEIYVDVEYSEDMGKTWKFVRGGEGVNPGANGKADVFDAEVPARTARLYRAVAYGVI